MSPQFRFGERMAGWRKYRRLSQAKLAAKIKKLGGRCSSAAVAQWEKNKTSPTQKNLYLLNRVLGITPEQFWGPIPQREAKAA